MNLFIFFVDVYKDKLRVELKDSFVYQAGSVRCLPNLEVRVLHPCVDPCEEELLVFKDYEGKGTNPWIHYSEKVEADLNEFIGIKLAEQREREELEKLSSEERARLEKEKVSRILDSY